MLAKLRDRTLDNKTTIKQLLEHNNSRNKFTENGLINMWKYGHKTFLKFDGQNWPVPKSRNVEGKS